MPKYIKKRRSRFLNHPKSKRGTINRPPVSKEKIKMSSDTQENNSNVKRKNMRVLAGKKLQRSQKLKSFSAVAALILIIVFLFQTILPAGILQTVSNVIAVAGTGSYPIEVSGSQTINNVSMGNYYFVLTDSHISAFANSGKELFSDAHGFEKPVLSASKGRVLVYNQGGKQVNIYDLNERLATIETAHSIICASMSDSGKYAVTTHSEKSRLS